MVIRGAFAESLSVQLRQFEHHRRRMPVNRQRFFSSFRLLRFYTLDYQILLAMKMYTYRGTQRIVSRILYGAFQGCFLLVYYRILRTLYYVYQPNFEAYREIDVYYYYMTTRLFDNDPLLLYSMVFYAPYIMSLVHYAMFQFVRALPEEVEELVIFIRYHYDFKFTLIHCLINRYSIQQFNTRIEQMAAEMHFPTKRCFQKQDFEHFLVFFKKLETLFFWPSIAAASGVNIIFLLIYIYLLPFTLDTFAMHFWKLILINVGVVASVFIITTSTLMLKIYNWPWLRCSVFLMRSPGVRASIRNPSKVGVALKHLTGARKQFFLSLKGMKKLNRFVISRMITFSVIITLAGNIIFTTECFLGDMNIFMQIYLPIISGFQLGLFLTFINFLSAQTNKFYLPAKFYLTAYATIALNTRRQHFRSVLALARFIEDLYPARPWSFTFGAFGKISRRYLVGCLSIYGTLFMYMAPFAFK